MWNCDVDLNYLELTECELAGAQATSSVPGVLTTGPQQAEARGQKLEAFKKSAERPGIADFSPPSGKTL